MKPIVDILEERISAAMAAVTGQQDCAAIVSPATDPKFGDYQVNGVMALAKQLKTNPRKLAEQVVSKLNTDSRPPTPDPRLIDICEPPEVAGPGFINLRFKADFVADRLLKIHTDPLMRLGIEKIVESKRIVVDFSGPNIAKEMHVGHLRSTIIGDCICRMLEFLGHKVIRQNHIGDWGRQFGRVILGLWHICMADEKHDKENPYYRNELQELKAFAEDRKELETICRRIRDRHEKDWREDRIKEPEEDQDGTLGYGKKQFKSFLANLKEPDPDNIWEKIISAYLYVNLLEESLVDIGLTIPTIIRHKEKNLPYESLSSHITSMLQKGGKKNRQELDAWKFVRKLTLKHCNENYKILGIRWRRNEIRGESYYRRKLSGVVKELINRGIAEFYDGAVRALPDKFQNKEQQQSMFIIKKSDGGYPYATTDLAALRYRVQELKADKIIYVTDARQKLHFEMLFSVADKAEWARRDNLKHVPFGNILGEDGTPLKTRSGENVKLKELLDEAVVRASKIVEEKNPGSAKKKRKKNKIAKAVGIGAVKYADYSNNRTSDYVFSFDKMLAMEGNTAPYMQYAYARIKSIERKAQEKGIDYKGEIANLIQESGARGQGSELLTTSAELELAKHLIRYGEAIQSAAADYRPNYLTAYLYELAQKFSVFYTNCPVLNADRDKRPTRLLLCDLTARTIKHGLSELLGIEVVEQM